MQYNATALRHGIGITHATIGFDGVRAGGRDWLPFAVWHHNKKVGWWLPPQAGSYMGGKLIGWAFAFRVKNQVHRASDFLRKMHPIFYKKWYDPPVGEPNDISWRLPDTSRVAQIWVFTFCPLFFAF